MKNQNFYSQLSDKSLNNEKPSQAEALDILSSKEVELLPLVNAAFKIRHTYWGKEVLIHILNNAQNGYCPEDCNYCGQAKTSEADIADYPMKSDEEILAEAKNAYERGAHRYCMVFAGRGPSERRTEHLSQLIRKIKSNYPLEICVSAGLIDDEKANTLKEAGLDRLNHNLNSSSKYYEKICSTHTYQDRVNTLNSAKKANIQLCSGVIVGMGESLEDIVEMASTTQDMNVSSIPVNFFIPIPGTTLTTQYPLTPEFCLRVLCLFRFFNPKAEIRAAAGRELHLRDLEALALYPANSLFLDGYLNAKGKSPYKTLQMIKDAGFSVKSDHSLDELLAKKTQIPTKNTKVEELDNIPLKTHKDLHPSLQNK